MARYWIVSLCLLAGQLTYASALKVFSEASYDSKKPIALLLKTSKALFEVGLGGSFRSFETSDLYPMFSANGIVSWQPDFNVGLTIYPMGSKLVSRILDTDIIIDGTTFSAGKKVNSLYGVEIYSLFYERVLSSATNTSLYPGLSMGLRHYALTLNDQIASYWHLIPALHLRMHHNLSDSWFIEEMMDLSYMYGWYSDNRLRLGYKWADSLYLGTEYRVLYTGVHSSKFKDYNTHYGIQLLLGHCFG